MLSIKKVIISLSLLVSFGSFQAMEKAQDLPFNVHVVNNVPNIRALGYQFVSLPIEISISNRKESPKVTQKSSVQLPQLNDFSTLTVKLYGEYKGWFGNLVINPLTISAEELISKANSLNITQNQTLYVVVGTESVLSWPLFKFTVSFKSAKPIEIGARMPAGNKVVLLAFPELKQKGLTTQTILTRLLTAGSNSTIEGVPITIKTYPIKEIWRYILELPEKFTQNQLQANYQRLNEEWGKENFPRETQSIRLIRMVLNNAYIGLGGTIALQFPAPPLLPGQIKEQQEQMKEQQAIPTPPPLPQSENIEKTLEAIKDVEDPQLQKKLISEVKELKHSQDLLAGIRAGIKLRKTPEPEKTETELQKKLRLRGETIRGQGQDAQDESSEDVSSQEW